MTATPAGDNAVLESLRPTLHRAVSGFDAIPDDRKRILKDAARFVAGRSREGEPARLTFICTHNSRRSHLAQVWAQTAAAFHGHAPVKTYSGGTEATACNPRTIAALERAGFQISATAGPTEDNPLYQIRFSPQAEPIGAFSKIYDQGGNPTDGYAAILTCSDADENCPVVRGAAIRISLPFRDPKEADGTDRESETYDTRSRQIAQEMCYLFFLSASVLMPLA